MATVITELGTVSGKREDVLVYNVSLTDASGGIDLKAANPDYRFGIKSFDISGVFGGTVWFEFLNDDEVIVGPRKLNSFAPYQHEFDPAIYCDKGKALKIKTSSAVGVSLIIEIIVGEPYPSSSISASPSAST